MFGSNAVLFMAFSAMCLALLTGWLVVEDRIDNPLRVFAVGRLEHTVEVWNASNPDQCLWQPRPRPPTSISFFYPSSRCGVWLHLQHWVPTEPLPERPEEEGERGPFWRGLALLLHAGQQNSGQYAQLIPLLHQLYILPVTMDFAGHGYSWGDRHHVVEFEDHVKDALSVLTLLRKPHVHIHGPEVLHKPPIFLVGDSMGGLVAKLLAQSQRPHTFAGVVLSSPLLRLPGHPDTWTVKVLELSAKLFPKLHVGSAKPPPEHYEPHPAGVIQDPDCSNCPVTANFGYQVVRAVDNSAENDSEVSFPLLVIHSVGDREADIEGSRALVSKARSESKRLIEVPGIQHHLLPELHPAATQSFFEFIEEQIVAYAELEKLLDPPSSAIDPGL